MLKDAIARLVERHDLARAEMAEAVEEIFSGAGTQAQMAAFMVALRMKGERPEEIVGAAQVMRRMATRIRPPAGKPVLDTCGTGGDGADTFNISTAVAFVAAAAGATVAKHGNRSVSSRCGSADVLAAAGVNIDVVPQVVEASLSTLGIGFLFAPNLHGVMKHVIGPRRELGVRTVFNLLGPLANPAGATHQLLGVYDGTLVPVVGEALASLGVERALVVHGEEGLDEVSPCGPTRAAWVEHGRVTALTLTPEQAGLPRRRLSELRGGEPAHNAALLRSVLGGKVGPLREAVALNAGAALWVAGFAADLREGAVRAKAVLDDGSALAKLEALAAFTRAGG